MTASVKYWLILISTCAAVNLVFYSFNIKLNRRQDPRFHSKYGSIKANVTPYSMASRTGLVPTIRSTASYNHPVRRLKNIDRAPETAAIYKEDNRVFRFKINRHSACSQNASGVVVVVVISKNGNFLRRQAIRNTWASDTKDFNTTVFFLVGTSETPSVQSQIEREAKLYGDVIQVDIVDKYEFLTYKSIAMLQWLNDYCYQAKYFLKADDDVYINIGNVLNSVRAHAQTNRGRFFFCHVFREAPPIRDYYSKWYISFEEYNRMFFPTYCSGTVYLFTSVILNDLYQAAIKTKFLKMEDVFLTGLAAENRDIAHLHDGRFSFEKRQPTGCSFKNALSGHGVTITDMFVIHSQLFSNEVDCETNENLVLKKMEEDIS